MSELLAGKVQSGFGDASRWLKLFNSAYSAKLGMPVFPGSLNIALLCNGTEMCLFWCLPSFAFALGFFVSPGLRLKRK